MTTEVAAGRGYLGGGVKGRDANGSGILIGSAMTSASWVEEEGLLRVVRRGERSAMARELVD
jgi:hypothetical protein